MSNPKQIIDAIFATSGYSLQDYLDDLGLVARSRDDLPTLSRRLLTTKQAAQYLQVSVTTMWRLTKRGDLTPVRVAGRTQFDLLELERYIRQQTKSAEATWRRL